MDIISYIIILIFFSFLVIGGIYLISSLLGPRRIEEIERLMDRGRIREAIQLLEKLLEKDDRDMKARYLLGLCHQKESNHPAAILEFRQCIKVGKYSPEAPEIHIRKSLAESLIEVGNKNDAKNEYLILTTIQPENYENYFQVGKLYFQAGIYPKAINFFQKALANNPNHADTLAYIGQAQFHVSAYQDARNNLIKAIQLKTSLKVARYYLGLALRFTGDLEWALKELEKSEREESIRDKVILAKGMVLIDQENYSKAISELDRGINHAQPGSDTAIQMLYLIALAAEKNRDIGIAIDNWEKIEKMKPGYRDVKEKLRQYSEFRTDDTIKDFMIASAVRFEEICRNVVENMGYEISSSDLNSDSKLFVVASEEDGGQKLGVRNRHTLFWIQREMGAINENHLRDLQGRMRDNNAGKAIIMTTGEYTPGAINYASTRPLDLFDSSGLADQLKNAM